MVLTRDAPKMCGATNFISTPKTNTDINRWAAEKQKTDSFHFFLLRKLHVRLTVDYLAKKKPMLASRFIQLFAE